MAQSDVPATMKALVIEDIGVARVKDCDVPTIEDDEVLIKVVAICLNPTDWKYLFSPRAKVDAIVGCDLSGTVVGVGKDVSSLKVGDHVATIKHGSAYPGEGAFAEYAKAPAELVWAIPENTLTFEESSTYNVAFLTPVQMFYHTENLALVEPPEKVSTEEWVLIYGGSSAVGQFAIQFARLSGYKVVTTASPHNHDLVRSLGADVVLDYHDSNVVDQIKGATGNTLKVAFDTISEKDTQRICAAALGPDGGKLGVILGPQWEAIGRSDVKVSYTLLYTAQGRPLDFGPNFHIPAKPQDRAQMVEFLKKVPGLIKDGLIKPPKIKVWEGGLDAIPEGLAYMREGKVSAEKIVYKV